MCVVPLQFHGYTILIRALFKRTLREILEYTKWHTARKWVFRIMQYKSEACAIDEYRERLKHALDVFNVSTPSCSQAHDVPADVPDV